jgi:hypothetical protein
MGALVNAGVNAGGAKALKRELGMDVGWILVAAAVFWVICAQPGVRPCPQGQFDSGFGQGCVECPAGHFKLSDGAGMCKLPFEVLNVLAGQFLHAAAQALSESG